MKSFKKMLEAIKELIENDVPAQEIKKIITDFQELKKQSWVKLKTNAERAGFIIYFIISLIVFLLGGG